MIGRCSVRLLFGRPETTVYKSPDGRYYVQFSGLGSLYFVRREGRPYPVATAQGLPNAIKECDAAYRRSL
jgi:hypothetical protein